MTSRSDDSSNPSWEKMINDYEGDSSEADFNQSDVTFGSSDHDGVSIARSPIDMGVGEVGVDLPKRLRLWRAKSIQWVDDLTRTNMILSIDSKERSWRVLLQEDSLRKSSLWNHTTFAQSGNPYPRIEDLVTYACIRHGFEILCGIRFLEPVTNTERAFVAMTMLNVKFSSEEALKRQMERLEKRKGKKAATTSSTPTVIFNDGVDQPERVTPAVENSKKQPRREEISDDVMARFPTDTCHYSDPGPILKEVDQLLFPKDKTRLTKIGASRVVDWGLTGAIQSQIFLRKDVKNLSKKFTSLSSSNSKLKKEVRETKSGAEKALKEVSDKLAKVEEENARLRAFLKSSKENMSQTDDMLVDVIERLDKATDKAVIQTRGRLMQQYLLGETDTWDVAKDIEIWEQWKKLKELEDEVEDVEPQEQFDAA
ncbi:hypothetical protein LWI29_008907 [Acer saccharum]|uniref:Uncharacterized protein n=1 Tax=Acer saccharum TaxID=4024 RepID=A0AA39W8Q0_ACESA|nr:hypothetical protein LWI29_008907 [Acer saccharum]